MSDFDKAFDKLATTLGLIDLAFWGVAGLFKAALVLAPWALIWHALGTGS